VSGAAGRAVTSLIPDTGCTAGDWVAGAPRVPKGGNYGGVVKGVVRPGTPRLGRDGSPYPLSEGAGKVGATLTGKPAPPADTEVRSP